MFDVLIYVRGMIQNCNRQQLSVNLLLEIMFPLVYLCLTLENHNYFSLKQYTCQKIHDAIDPVFWAEEDQWGCKLRKMIQI